MKLIRVSPVHEVYPVDLVKPVVVPKLKLAPVGGLTNPTEANKMSLLPKFAKTKSPGSWLAVLKTKFAGLGEITLGLASRYVFNNATSILAAFPFRDPPVLGNVYVTPLSLKPKLDFPVAFPP